ncbi:MAG: hypothetical protein V1709_10460 [Planctomycetota bacterium]
MPKRRYFIPLKDDDFFTFQGSLVNKVVANKTAWGIPDPAVNVLVNHRTQYEPLYHKSQSKNSRTSIDVVAHRRERKAYEKDIRKFVNAHIRFNDRMTDSDRISIGVPARDIEPSPRPRIETVPAPWLMPIGGGTISVRVRVESDQSRANIHPFADAVEVRYIFVPKGAKPPNSSEDCPKVYISKKALFTISCGVENAGLTFYGSFRWVNFTSPERSGPWSNVRSAVIA